MTHYTISTDAVGQRWISAVDASGEAHDLTVAGAGESVRAVVEDLLAADAGGMIPEEDRRALRALAMDAD